MTGGYRRGWKAPKPATRRHHAAWRPSGRTHKARRSPKSGDLDYQRHRHHYEVNVDYKERLEDCGLVFAGMSPDGVLPETVEYPDHPWFIGVQYHPELKSRPLEPHPLFASFISAAVDQSRLV